MVTIFCRVTAELSPDFLVNFPRQFDFTGMLTKICEDVGVGISFQNETFLLHGDWISIGRTYNMLVSTLAVYGNASSVYNSHTDTLTHGSRPFSALVEAAEAISRGVELQEQVQNELTQMNKLTDPTSSASCSRNSDHAYENVSSYQQNSSDDQENTSECSAQESQDSVNYQTSSSNMCLEIKHEQDRTYVDRGLPFKQKLDNQSLDSDVPIKHQEKDDKCELSHKHLKNTDDHDVGVEPKIASGHDVVSSIWNCNMCDFKAKSRPHLLKHKSQFHMHRVVKCEICDKIFSSISYMKRHLGRHKDVSHSCEECGNKYKDLKTLKEHIKTHDKDYVKPQYECDSCPKSFCSIYKRKCHFKSEHLGIKRTFLCQTCGKSFTTNKTLQQHVNWHKGIKPYKCPKCGKCFTYESALNDHLFVHVEEKTFLCEYPDCTKAFRQRSALKMHEKIHKNPNQFECTQCGRGFTQKQALQRHVRSHKGLKPFRCKYCSRSFGDASIIRRHMKLVHKLNKDIDKWREDVIEETVDDKESNREKETIDSQQTAFADVTVLQTVETTNKDGTFKPNTESIRPNLKENAVQIMNPDTEENTSNMQNVFVTFNLPSQNLVLANAPASTEFNQNSPPQLIQYHFKATEVAESVSGSSDKSENDEMNAKQGDLLQPETDSTFIEREQVQLLTENLDGTFNTTVDFSKLKRNLELLTKPGTSVDMNMCNDQQTDILKPDGTEAEMPLTSSPENTSRLGELETLSDSLGLSVSQFQSCYYNLGNQ